MAHQQQDHSMPACSERRAFISALPCSYAYYAADIQSFIGSSSDEIFGVTASRSTFAIELEQKDAWIEQTNILKQAVQGLQGTLFLEFMVPRIGSRIDAVVISGAGVFVIEFKVGEEDFKTEHYEQVWDYALDLKNFHKASHDLLLMPMLVATKSVSSDREWPSSERNGVYSPVRCNVEGLRDLLLRWQAPKGHPVVDCAAWAAAPYEPTPTIIQAAQALYSQHSVEAIARHGASGRNLAMTSARVEEIIDTARANSRKVIIFVTGVPGAGKTLVGLNVATRRRDRKRATHAVYLSGNAPLVKVLSEALARDEVIRLAAQVPKPRKGEIRQKVKAFIQNVHHFRDAGLRDSGPPSDRVVIFDEAQRAWNAEMTRNFMARKKGIPDFTKSEPEFLISYLDRHRDWAAIVCLVGGGQEINTGEAGISAWLDAAQASFPGWHIYISPNLHDTEYAAGHALQRLNGKVAFTTDENLHLAVSMRSFKADKVSSFVKAVLDCENKTAAEIVQEFLSRYPIALTRDLDKAKQWVRDHAQGSERYGLVASSAAYRLKPHAIDVRVEVEPIHWFLNGRDDTRSSFYMEDAATEFQVQGLELDWVCVTWDADLRFNGNGWDFRSFVGSKWNRVKAPERQQFLRNAYRVLLTRARQGMVIFVPKGDESDRTRQPEFYDRTFEYLAGTGLPILDK